MLLSELPVAVPACIALWVQAAFHADAMHPGRVLLQAGTLVLGANHSLVCSGIRNLMIVPQGSNNS